MRKSKLFFMSVLLAASTVAPLAQAQTVHTCDSSGIHFEDCKMPAVQASTATERKAAKKAKIHKKAHHKHQDVKKMKHQ